MKSRGLKMVFSAMFDILQNSDEIYFVKVR